MGGVFKLDWGQVLTIAATSGVIAGIVNQGAGLLRDMWNRRHQQRAQTTELAFKREAQAAELAHQVAMQDSQRAHADEERRDLAHSEARMLNLPMAVEVLQWLNWAYIDFGYAMDVDYVAVNVPEAPFSSVVGAIVRLRQISTEHPTKVVRDHADRLASEMDFQFNVLTGDRVGDPSDATLSDWMRRTTELIEALHDPRPLTPIGSPAS